MQRVAPALPRCAMHFGADRCKSLRHCPGASSSLRMKHPSQGHFIRCGRAAYRAGGSMLLTMRAHSACPLPIPECRSAVVTTLPAPPSALALVYSDIANCQPMAVTTVLGNLDAGNLAAAVSARERNDERVISRNRAPATICSAVSRRASRTRRRHPPSTSRLLRRPVGNPRSRSHRSPSRVRLILRPYDCDPIIQYCGVLSR